MPTVRCRTQELRFHVVFLAVLPSFRRAARVFSWSTFQTEVELPTCSKNRKSLENLTLPACGYLVMDLYAGILGLNSINLLSDT